jgi:hypothetical protein
MHTHLGVIFSNDCKWTKHIDVLIERTSKQLNILRKLKYVLINVCKFSSLCAIWPIQVSSANNLPKPVILSATSFIKIRKSNGPKTDPWGTPALENNVLFDFNNISLSPVHMHTHLGVIFSNDCKWTKHIDVLIERTSKQLNILRKD